VLQVVRATDSTDRSTTSSSYVDVTGLSVTITPQKSDSAIIVQLFADWYCEWSTGDVGYTQVRITDTSNNAISGAEANYFGNSNLTGISTRTNLSNIIVLGYATPATTSAVTYKVRFKSATANVTSVFRNATTTAQLYAIEVSA